MGTGKILLILGQVDTYNGDSQVEEVHTLDHTVVGGEPAEDWFCTSNSVTLCHPVLSSSAIYWLSVVSVRPW